MLLIGNILGGSERKNSYFHNYLSTITKEDINQKRKEYLMTEFNIYMEDNLQHIKEKGIEAYFKAFDISRYLTGIVRDDIRFKEGCIIKYNANLALFELNVGTHIYRFYPIITNEEIKYKFVVINN